MLVFISMVASAHRQQNWGAKGAIAPLSLDKGRATKPPLYKLKVHVKDKQSLQYYKTE